MEPLTVGSLFSGVGGLDLGLERAGMRVLWQCEIDPFLQLVLLNRFPHVRRLYADVKTLRPPTPIPAVDLLCGGFPCQPFSTAGARRGIRDARWLWPEFERLVGLLRPRYVVVENVAGLLFAGGGMGVVLGDLAALGYDAEWESVPAAAFGAPHVRDRVFIVAYPDSSGRSSQSGIEQEKRPTVFGASRPRDVAAAGGQGLQGGELAGAPDRTAGQARADQAWRPAPERDTPEASDWWRTEPDVGRVAHGVPSRVDRLRALGNAVVPQVAEWVGRQIVKHAMEA